MKMEHHMVCVAMESQFLKSELGTVLGYTNSIATSNEACPSAQQCSQHKPY